MISPSNDTTRRLTRPITRFWKPIAAAIGSVLLIAIALHGLGSGYTSNALFIESGLLDKDSEITGWFTIQWMDDQSGQLVDVQYLLFDEMGTSIELHFPDLTSIEPPTHLLELNGRKVTVKGVHRTKGVTNMGQSTFDVFSTEVDETSPSYSETTTLTGSLPYITLLCEVPGGYAESRPLSYFQNMYGSDKPKLDHYWREISYDAINMNGSDVAGWFVLPHPEEYYLESGFSNAYSLLQQDCLAAADPNVYFPDYVGINMMFDVYIQVAMGGGWYGTLDGVEQRWGLTWLPNWGFSNLDVIEHEMGHSFGLGHSSGQYGRVYDNRWDVMSAGSEFNQVNIDPVYGYIGLHPIAHHKQRLGWVPEQRQLTVSWDSTQSFVLERLAFPGESGYLIAFVPLLDDLSYTVETRDLAGYDAGLPGKAVIIHEIIEGYPYIIDPDLNGDTGDAGAMWTVGESYVDSRFGLTITVESETVTGFTINVTLGPEPDFNFSNCDSVFDLSAVECEALVALYDKTEGASWWGSFGWRENVWPCDWKGVECQDGTVVRLDLGQNNLAGTIPLELGNLSNLLELDLSDNQLTGSIPSELENLSNLLELYLWDNQLTGNIPSELGNLSNLLELYLSDNQLTGSIPSELGNLSNLKVLDLSWNQLSGDIPSELADLSNLRELFLSGNQLTGPIPIEITGLSHLWSLYLSENRLTGTIPPELGTSSVYELSLSGNRLIGSIPLELANKQGLGYLWLDRNQLSGEIPQEFANLPYLRGLALSGNQLTGGIPPEWADHYFDFIRVSYNSLETPEPMLFESLDSQFPEWRSHQTVAPTQLRVDDISFFSVRLAWQPIEYSDDTGHYEIGVRLESEDEYTVLGTTDSKLENEILVNGLLADSTYELAVRTFTPAHAKNPGDLLSQFSQPVTVTTRMVSDSVFLPTVGK